MAQTLYPVIAEAAVFTASIQLNPTMVPKKAVAEETFAVPGLTTDMRLIVDAPSLEAGLFLIGAEVSAADTLLLRFWNSTGSNIDPALQSFEVKGF